MATNAVMNEETFLASLRGARGTTDAALLALLTAHQDQPYFKSGLLMVTGWNPRLIGQHPALYSGKAFGAEIEEAVTFFRALDLNCNKPIEANGFSDHMVDIPAIQALLEAHRDKPYYDAAVKRVAPWYQPSAPQQTVIEAASEARQAVALPAAASSRWF